MSTEDAKKKTLRDIEDMEAVNSALPIIKKVITQWDGKVLNKRFNDALQAAGLPGRVYLSTSYETVWMIQYQPENTNNYYTVLSGSRPSCKYYSPENSFVTPEKRISAAQAFTLIEAGRAERLQKITAYREHLRTWETKKAQIEMLKKQLKTITDGIPSAMLDYFGMRVKFY